MNNIPLVCFYATLPAQSYPSLHTSRTQGMTFNDKHCDSIIQCARQICDVIDEECSIGSRLLAQNALRSLSLSFSLHLFWKRSSCKTIVVDVSNGISMSSNLIIRLRQFYTVQCSSHRTRLQFLHEMRPNEYQIYTQASTRMQVRTHRERRRY